MHATDLSPCPQGVCILIISGQEVLGWQRAGWGPWCSVGVWTCSSGSTMSFRTRFFASSFTFLHTLASPYWACHLLVMRWPFITSSGSRNRRISTSQIFFSLLPMLTGGKPFPEDYTNCLVGHNCHMDTSCCKGVWESGGQINGSNQDSLLGLVVRPPFPEPIIAYLIPGLNWVSMWKKGMVAEEMVPN